MNGAIDAGTYLNTAGDAMVIGATQTWRDFATTGNPALSRLNGVYTVRAWCSSGDWFEGAITFTGTTADNATYTTAPTPTPTSTTASPTPTSASPTPTSASPGPTTASPSPTSPSPSPTLTSTASPSPTLTSTTSPTPIPSSSGLQPGEHLGIAVGPDGNFLQPNATLRAGDNVTVIGGGFGPGALLKYSVFSQEVVFGYGYADTNGSTSYRFVVPNLPDGQHRFAISGATRIVVFPFTLGATSPTATATSGSSASPSAEVPSASGGSTDHLAATGGGAEITTLVLLALLALAVGANLKLPRLETVAPSGRHVHGGGRPVAARHAKGRHQ
jgi:hypothetical protein